jgi:hypothetical protein
MTAKNICRIYSQPEKCHDPTVFAKNNMYSFRAESTQEKTKQAIVFGVFSVTLPAPHIVPSNYATFMFLKFFLCLTLMEYGVEIIDVTAEGKT